MSRLLPILTVLLIAPPVLLGAYGVLARFVLHGEVNGDSLASSVGGESPWGGDGECRRAAAGGREWRCAIADASTMRRYRVEVRPGSSCWEARRIGAAPHERSFTGCVRRWE